MDGEDRLRAGTARVEVTDEELLRRFVAERDESSFRSLYAAHTPTLLLLALRLLREDGAAQDAVQETWIRAAGAGHRFAARSSVRTWLIGILINCCREETRRAPRDTAAPNHEPAARAVEPEVDLERAIRNLAPGYREVLLLHDLHGYTHEEIAKILGIDSGTSKSQLSRARERVREQLRGSGGVDHGRVE